MTRKVREVAPVVVVNPRGYTDDGCTDVDMEDERYRGLYGEHRMLVDKVASGMQDVWTASGWLSTLDVASPISSALFGGTRPANELKALQALAASIDSEAALAERLQAGGVAEAIAKAVFPRMRQLGEAKAATGQQLHGKFVQERSRPQCIAWQVR